MVYVAGASLALGVGLFVVALGRRPGRRAVRRPGPANRMCVLAFVFALLAAGAMLLVPMGTTVSVSSDGATQPPRTRCSRARASGSC